LNEEYFLDERELKSLERHPLASIGAHTTSHAALATLDAASALAELTDNRRYLENLLQTSVCHVAYPYGTPGACGLREECLANAAGFQTAATTRQRQLHDQKVDRFALPRISCQSRSAFTARMSGIFEVERMLRWR
jgi:peptidoglycan/xylan/chitin deacetylase (PgdA/CDA1 family)